MKLSLQNVISICMSIFCISTNVIAGLINFENIPGGVPSEGLTINNQFLATEGVSFQLENGNSPVLAQVGAPTTAFAGPPNHTGADNPVPGQNIGSFFLTDDGVLSTSLISPALIANYSLPTSAASGVILDIDFDESFLIQARDNLGNVLETINIQAGDPNTGDGIATFWSLNRPTNDIASIKFAGSRTISGGFGLGFDNFNARAVPAPSAILFFSSGLIGLIGMVKRKTT